jgi:glycosyltransferase involved in cell wall biosynthesis
MEYNKQNSKFLSYVLRHDPSKIGIKLDKNGWIDIDELLEKCRLSNVNISREELQDIYTNSKFSVVPSEYLEAYGNIILESLAFGKTVITSDLVGIKNEIEQNRVGLTYSFQNPEALEEKMIELLSNSSLKSELESNIPSYLATKTFSKHFEDLLDIYEDLLTRNR